MGKRKRQINGNGDAVDSVKKAKTAPSSDALTHIQIITGTYDRILHGITTSIPPVPSSEPLNLQFSDTFLLESHFSAMTALALSPPSTATPAQKTQKLILASGSTDARIHLYHLSAHPPSRSSIPLLSRSIAEDPSNRALGTLTPHSSSVTSLCFPSRGKLISAGEDSTICITRTRDWTTLGAIKAPIPKAGHRPSGDTAEGGRGPSGLQGVAVHGSGKIMLSVGKGERCLRLWNLVTGKKAGVLDFEKRHLETVGEGRRTRGEGRSVVWGLEEQDGGDEFAVAFERGILVFGMDSQVRCKVVTPERTKLHRMTYLDLGKARSQLLMVSTEDGRVLFFSTKNSDLIPSSDDTHSASSAKLVAQLGGKPASITGRIKDFAVLKLDDGCILIVTGSSDGQVRVWKVPLAQDLETQGGSTRQVGELLGMYDTGNRITCLVAFVMLSRPEGADEELTGEEDEDDDEEGEEEEEEEEEDDFQGFDD